VSTKPGQDLKAAAQVAILYRCEQSILAAHLRIFLAIAFFSARITGFKRAPK